MKPASIADVRSLLHSQLSDLEVERWFLSPNVLLGNDLPINYVRARELESVLNAAHAIVNM